MNGLIAQPHEWESIEGAVQAAALMVVSVIVWAALAVALVAVHYPQYPAH